MSEKKPVSPTDSEVEAVTALGIAPDLVAEKAKEWAKGEGFQPQIFKAIANHERSAATNPRISS